MKKLINTTTTILLDKTTREELKKLKLTNRESYNEIVIRLINKNKNDN